MDELRELEANMAVTGRGPRQSSPRPIFGSKVIDFKAKPFENICLRVLGSDFGSGER